MRQHLRLKLPAPPQLTPPRQTITSQTACFAHTISICHRTSPQRVQTMAQRTQWRRSPTSGCIRSSQQRGCSLCRAPLRRSGTWLPPRQTACACGTSRRAAQRLRSCLMCAFSHDLPVVATGIHCTHGTHCGARQVCHGLSHVPGICCKRLVARGLWTGAQTLQRTMTLQCMLHPHYAWLFQAQIRLQSTCC